MDATFAPPPQTWLCIRNRIRRSRWGDLRISHQTHRGRKWPLIRVPSKSSAKTECVSQDGARCLKIDSVRLISSPASEKR
jgi:hypothetical protein